MTRTKAISTFQKKVAPMILGSEGILKCCWTRNELIARMFQNGSIGRNSSDSPFSAKRNYRYGAPSQRGVTLQEALSQQATRTTESRNRKKTRLKSDENPKHTSSSSSSSSHVKAYTKAAAATTTTTTTTTVRLSKRMSELDLCSRREADKYISQGMVLVRGKLVQPILGQRVDVDESDIAIIRGGVKHRGVGAAVGTAPFTAHQGEEEEKEEDKDYASAEKSTESFYTNTDHPFQWDWSIIRGDTVVLNKPRGYVSGQPDPKDNHPPAVQLLTRSNLFLRDNDDDDPKDDELRETLTLGSYLHFARRRSKITGRQQKSANATEQKRRGGNDRRPSNVTSDRSSSYEATLINYAPAGRLDLDSAGLLIFTKLGVLAKKLVSARGSIEKEYAMQVEPARHLLPEEKATGIPTLSPPTFDLSPLLRGGCQLWDDPRPLRPLVKAEWVYDEDEENNQRPPYTLRMVLKEGRKRQIRRMCRELLGMHVLRLERVRIGPVVMDDLPEGKWRPLREEEVRAILATSG